MIEAGFEDRDSRRERQELIARNNRLEALATAYREIADVREVDTVIDVIMRGSHALAPKARVGIFERGAVIKSEDHLGACEMTLNPEWRITTVGEGEATDLVAPIYDGSRKFLCGVMGASRRILYLDDLEYVDDALRTDFTSYIRFTGVVISAITAAERDRLAAMTDALTGLANRRALEKVVSKMVIDNRKFAYVIIDLDNFKQINDKQGHAAGDTLLKKVGEILNKNTRSNDFPSRLAGDEFVVILTTGDMSAGAARVGEWLNANGVSASTGLARFPEDGKTPQELYSASDKRLYENKDARRKAGLR